MGLDITIIEYLGKKKDGYLKTRTPIEDLPYSSDRIVIRKHIIGNVDLDTLSSDKYYDYEEYYRPSDFKKAYEWCESLDKEPDRVYIRDLLKSLQMNDNYYLDYGY
jgi:hypothetical protein